MFSVDGFLINIRFNAFVPAAAREIRADTLSAEMHQTRVSPSARLRV